MAREMLKNVGLGDRMKHKPKEMSGGQQQRVGIARAFVSNPEIVFADEPTGNLDSKTTKEVMDIIKNMAKANNQTIVMVTHDKGLTQYADRIIHIFDGRVEEIIDLKKENTAQQEETAEPEVTDTYIEQPDAVLAADVMPAKSSG